MSFENDRKEILERLKIGKEMIYLSKEQCENIGLSTKEIIGLVETALSEHGKKNYDMPAKIGVHPQDKSFFHAMPAYLPKVKAVGMKWVGSYPDNEHEFALPQITGLLILNDVLSGLPIAVMDSVWITAMRTPAVSAIAAKKLHENAKTFGMYGCGVQGIEHVRYIQETLSELEEIYIYDIKEEAMDNLIESVEMKDGIKIIKGKSIKELAEKCEVLCSATVILKDPLAAVKDEWIRPGQTILACDLNTFFDPKTSKRADKYIVDSDTSHQLLDKQGYFPDGLPEIYCETGEIVANLKVGRESSDEIIVCSNIGMAVCDMVLARKIFDIALREKVGTILPL